MIYGPDADVFRPERWLTQDESKLSEMNRCWMPVGAFLETALQDVLLIMPCIETVWPGISNMPR